MARLFVVPAIIIAVVLACAIFVTLGFGWTGVGKPEDLAFLIDKLAAGTGEKVAGIMLLPREKELWQTALEVANRLASPDIELKHHERPAIAARLAGVLDRTIPLQPYTQATRQRITFMSIALGRLQDPSGVSQFRKMLQSPEYAVRAAAVQGLCEMSSLPEARAEVSMLLPLLAGDDSREVRMIAAAALGQLATPSDSDVVSALRKQLADDDEVRWNAALALTKLGSDAARSDVLEMLDRRYWERQEIRDDPESDRRRPIAEREISRNIRGVLAFVNKTADVEIHAAIEVLTNDRNPEISRAARAALAPRSSSAPAPQTALRGD